MPKFIEINNIFILFFFRKNWEFYSFFIEFYKKSAVFKIFFSQKNTYISRFTCPMCYASFDLSDPFKIHLRKHDNLKPFGCSYCFKQFSSRSVCRRHVQLMHENQKRAGDGDNDDDDDIDWFVLENMNKYLHIYLENGNNIRSIRIIKNWINYHQGEYNYLRLPWNSVSNSSTSRRISLLKILEFLAEN